MFSLNVILMLLIKERERFPAPSFPCPLVLVVNKEHKNVPHGVELSPIRPGVRVDVFRVFPVVPASLHENLALSFYDPGEESVFFHRLSVYTGTIRTQVFSRFPCLFFLLIDRQFSVDNLPSIW